MDETQKIVFSSTEQGVVYFDPPTPAAKVLPEWLRAMPTRAPQESPHDFPVGTVKKCMPFHDAITGGWIFVLPEALYVTQNEDGVFFSWRNAETGVKIESHSAGQMPVELQAPGGVWKFIQPWAVELPEGYSALYTHPLNRHDLPFRTFSGIVDDGYTSPVQFPFIWIGTDAETIIDAGTPIAQMIPFKREAWESEIVQRSPVAIQAASVRTTQRIEGYRKLIRKPKVWR